jgi:hypothetical protein
MEFDYSLLKKQLDEVEFEDVKKEIENSKTYIETELENNDEYIAQFGIRDENFDGKTITFTPTVIHFKKQDNNHVIITLYN